MIPNPILKVLSTIRKHRVQALLMGGQACVFYGAAEFSRDTDLAILADAENLARLREAMEELRAEVIAVPSFDASYLEAGHAVHFRCHHPEADKMRVDVMARMRGVAPFSELWERRTTIQTPDGTICELLSLPDLVLAKKTQRDKDWPMIRRLLEAHYLSHQEDPNSERIAFWFQELRTPVLLIASAKRWPEQAEAEAVHRALLRDAIDENEDALSSAIGDEERLERNRDKEHWAPLKKQLEQLRRQH